MKTRPLYKVAQLFRNNAGPLLIRSGENCDEFFPSIARQKVRSPQNPRDQRGDLFKTSISSPMPIAIVY
jgi:hypothetical protein